MKLDPPQEREGQEGEKEEFNFGEGIPSKTQNGISPSLYNAYDTEGRTQQAT